MGWDLKKEREFALVGKLGNCIADLQSQGMDVRKSLPLVVHEELSKELRKDQKTSCEVRAWEGARFVWNTLGREHEAEHREAGIKGLSGLSKV